ncbi:DUF3122 domain-containing protein [Lyngbya aestuarii]|uniref:DUF3122 domain-containing protein n=1 Tax=Lyngbya aestuarii TaxID=118322 RepID=UPI00403E32DE
MGRKIRQFSSRLLLLAVLLLTTLVFLGNFTNQLAVAAMRQQEEAPGQILYQSRHTLQDKTGNTWQVVLFKRAKLDNPGKVSLRLVGFPGVVEITHPQPLQIITNSGEIFQAEDLFSQNPPAVNVGQYNFQDVLTSLPKAVALNLCLQINDNQSIELRVPRVVVLEWQTVAAQEDNFDSPV